VDAIAAAARGARVLDVTLDRDHNRSVITMAGGPAEVSEAAFRAVEQAVARIDLTKQLGVHPRIGAADVVPFVPVRGVTLADCAGIAVEVGERIWRELGVPVYLYEAAARRPDRVNLENIRRGGFEALREAVRSDPARRPDIGGPELHPAAGAVVTGARKFLIAFNINLSTPDLAIAREIAAAIRTSSGGLPCVKALGVALESRQLSQVTMNLTDFERTPVHVVFARVRELAAARGAGIAGSELIGLIPRAALEGSEEWLPTLEDFHPCRVLENALEL
jgi:glutamate formiminotransferase